jgi:NitT/TauT family transport system substrate-binding protein
MIFRALSYRAAGVAGTAAIAAIGSLTGCAHGGGADAGSGHLEASTITVDSVPAAEEAGLYVAQAKGFFGQQGLTVKINSITGGEAGIPDLQSGHADLVAGNYVSFILAQLAGKFGTAASRKKPVNLRIIAAGSQLRPGSEALYVMPDARYKTVGELAEAHAKVGLNTANDVGGVMVGAALAGAGYKLSDIQQVIPAGGFPALLRMLPAGEVNAAWLPQPLGDMAEQQIGAVPLADFDQGAMENYPFTGYIGTWQWVRSHPNTVAAFLRALNAGQRLADTDRGAAEQAMEKYTGIPAIIADTMPLDSYPLEMDVPELQRVANSLVQFGLTKTSYQISNMIEAEPGLVAR